MLGFGSEGEDGLAEQPSSGTTFTKTISATVTTVVTVLKNVGHIVPTITTTTTASIINNVGKIVSAAISTTASIGNAIGKFVTATIATVASITNNVGHIVPTITVTTTASLIKTAGKIVSATVTTATSFGNFAISKLVLPVVTTVVTIPRAITHTLPTITATTTATVLKNVGHIVPTIVSTTSASLIKNAGKIISATVTTATSFGNFAVGKIVSAIVSTGITRPTAWNTSRVAVGSLITFSNNNLTATEGSGNVNPAIVSTTSRTGKLIYKGNWTTVSGRIDADAWGACNASFDPTLGVNHWTGVDTNSIAMYNDGQVWYNGASIASTGLTFASGDYILVAVDTKAGLIWFQKNGAGNWNGTVGGVSADPATGVGGLSLGFSGPVFASATLYGNASPQSVLTGDFLPGVVPSGYMAWDNDGALVFAISTTLSITTTTIASAIKAVAHAVPLITATTTASIQNAVAITISAVATTTASVIKAVSTTISAVVTTVAAALTHIYANLFGQGEIIEIPQETRTVNVADASTADKVTVVIPQEDLTVAVKEENRYVTIAQEQVIEVLAENRTVYARARRRDAD